MKRVEIINCNFEAKINCKIVIVKAEYSVFNSINNEQIQAEINNKPRIIQSELLSTNFNDSSRIKIENGSIESTLKSETCLTPNEGLIFDIKPRIDQYEHSITVYNEQNNESENELDTASESQLDITSAGDYLVDSNESSKLIEKKQSIAVNKATSDYVKEELFGNIKTKDITKQYLNFKIKGKVQFDNKKIPMLVKSSQTEKPKEKWHC